MSDARFIQQGFEKRLAHVVEECGEVVAAAGKTQRWGAWSVNPLLPKAQQEANIDWLRRELVDLGQAIVRLDAAMQQDLGCAPMAGVAADKPQTLHVEGPRLVMLESPFAGADAPTRDRNVAYARAALADCLRRGEAPIASHLLYTQPGVLDDDKPNERTLGIAAGLAWARFATATVVYADFGLSPGMQQGVDHAAALGRPVEQRLLGGIWRNASLMGLKREARP